MRSHPVGAHGWALRYVDIPGDRPLVLLHGLGSASSFAFPDVVSHPDLRGYRSILVDLLGFGYSDRPAEFGYSMQDHAGAVIELLDELGIEGAILFGHSMGGSIAILVAADRPSRVAHLILAEANLDPGPGIVSGIITSQSERHFVETGHAAFVRRMRDGGFGGYARTVEAASPVAAYRSAVDLIAPRDPTFREMLERLPTPSTFLFSEETRGDGDVVRLPRTGTGVDVVPSCGHDMMTDNPDGLAAAIRRAVRGSLG
jgi:pimeloyl-ACP methyl ester carboxylesterase